MNRPSSLPLPLVFAGDDVESLQANPFSDLFKEYSFPSRIDWRQRILLRQGRSRQEQDSPRSSASMTGHCARRCRH